MAKVADSGEDHGDVEPIGRFNDCGVAHRPTRLNDGGCPCLSDGLQAIGEREEGIGGSDAALQREDRFHGSEAGRIDPGHLAGTDADGLTVALREAGEDDGIGFDVFADPPCEQERAQFFRGGFANSGNLQVGFVDTNAVRILHEQPSGDLLKHSRSFGGSDLKEAKVFLGGQELSLIHI